MTVVDAAAVRRIADMHAVYRMYDERDRLLYIGISGRVGRFDEHAVKRWFPLVSRIALEWHATSAQAAVAERRAIATERPRYNIAGSPVAPKLAGRKAAPAPAAEPEPPMASALADILEVFGDARGLHWQVVADRLAEQFPHRWGGVTRETIRAQCVALGVPTVTVRFPTTSAGKVLAGCRRADVEQALARQFLKQTG